MTNIFYPEKTPIIKFDNPKKPTHQECVQYLTAFLKQFEEFKESDLEEITSKFEYMKWNKGQTIFEVGEVHEFLNFIVLGAFEFYTEDEMGRNIIGFLTECNFCSPIKNFYSRQPSEEGAQCEEVCYGLRISLDNFLLLMQRKDFFYFFQNLNLKMLEYFTNRIKTFQVMDARGRYELLIKETPEVFTRFSSQRIARFLGIKPETLSRIRKDERKN